MWSCTSPKPRALPMFPVPATTSIYPAATLHRAGWPLESADCHASSECPSKSTAASDGGGRKPGCGPGSTTGGWGRVVEWMGYSVALLLHIAPLHLGIDDNRRRMLGVDARRRHLRTGASLVVALLAPDLGQ